MASCRHSYQRLVPVLKKVNRVLFLCSGNYYRSRFAEIFFNWHAQQRGLCWTADSRGLALDERNAGPISRHTLQTLSARGILSDSFTRLPVLAADADFAAAHCIVAVKEAEHRHLIESRFPAWHGRVEYWHVHDLDGALPHEAISELEQHVLKLLDRLAIFYN